MTEIKKTPIPQRLKNVSADHPYVAGAVDIFDDDLDAKQSDINHDQDVSNQGFRRDIDKNADDIAALNVEVQSEQMVIGATVFDAWPTLNSSHPVTSDGIYRKDVQAEVVVGDPTGDWNPTTAEAAYERCQRQIELLNGSEVIPVADHTAVSSPDANKIYREQGTDSYTDWMYYDNAWYEIATYDFPGIDNEPTANSNNLAKSGGIYEENLLLKERLSATINEIVVNSYSVQANGTFGTTASSKHTTIPVVEGEQYILKAQSDISRYAFATANTYSSGGDVPLVSGTSVVTIPNGDEVIITVPENCTYLLLNGQSVTTIRKYVDNVYNNVANTIIDVTDNVAKGNLIRANISAGAPNIIPDKYKNALLGADYMYFSYKYVDGYLESDTTVGTHAYVYHVKAGDIVTLIGTNDAEDLHYRAWFVDEYALNVQLTPSAELFHKITDTDTHWYINDFLAPTDGDLVVYVPAGVTYRALKKVNNEALKNKRHISINEVVAEVGKAVCADTESEDYGELITLDSESRGASDYIDVSEYTHILTRIPTITAYYLNTPVFGGVFYNENKEPISNLFISERRVPATLYANEMTYVAVPEGAKYMRITDITVTGTDNTNPIIRDTCYGVTDEDAVINDEGGISELYFKDAVIYNMSKKMNTSEKQITLIPRPEDCSNLYWRTYQAKNFMYGSAGIYRLSWFPKVFVKGGSTLTINYNGTLPISIFEFGYVPLDSNFYRVFDTATGKINVQGLPMVGDDDYTGSYTLHLNRNTSRVVVEIGVTTNETVELHPADITDYVTSMTVVAPKWNNMSLEEDSVENNDDLFDQSTFVGDEETIKPLRVFHYSDIHHDDSAATNIENFIGLNRNRLDTILFTGDLVRSYYSSEGANWWRGLEALPTYSMFTIGNHDGATADATEYDQEENGVAWDGRGKDWEFEKYFEDYIESVGYTMPTDYDDPESPNYHAMFWHKDYSDQKIRLIGLDCMHRFDGVVNPETGAIVSPGLKHLTNEQETWLISKLNQTLDSGNAAYGYSVVIACHYPLDDFSGDNEEWDDTSHKFTYNQNNAGGRVMSYKTSAPVNFHLESTTSLDLATVFNMRNRVDNGYSQGQPYPNFTKGSTNNMGEIIKAWMTRGGKFVAWISGHVHRDYMYYPANYPEILTIACDCAGARTSPHHTYKSQSSELNGIANYYSIDTQNGLIKFIRIGHSINMYFNSHSYLCYDYINKKVLNEG